MLKNASSLAIVGLDTAENGPSKVRQVTNRIDAIIGGEGAPGEGGLPAYDGLDFIRHLTNFGRSVLGCIEAYDSESRHIFQH